MNVTPQDLDVKKCNILKYTENKTPIPTMCIYVYLKSYSQRYYSYQLIILALSFCFVTGRAHEINENTRIFVKQVKYTISRSTLSESIGRRRNEYNESCIKQLTKKILEQKHSDQIRRPQNTSDKPEKQWHRTEKSWSIFQNFVV